MIQCDVVIPAHNEACSIAQIVAVCKQAAVGDVIVVADACTDDTIYEASHADLVLEIPARDKGTAMAEGLKWVSADLVLFLDGDLVGLVPEIIRGLATAPPLDGQIVGLTESLVNGWSKAGFPPITGERRLPSEFARSVPMAGQGYKVELLIDAAVSRARLPHRTYLMQGVTNPTRVYTDPVGWSAMWVDLGFQSLRYLPDLARYTVS